MSADSRSPLVRPASASSGASPSRPATASSDGSLAFEGLREDSGRDRGGAVVVSLRAALEEERLALLAQTEQLRLCLEDEVDYRSRSVQPPPSLSELQSLRNTLQASIKQQHAPKGGVGATDAPGEQQPTLASPGAVRGASRRALSCLDAGPEQSAGAELLAARAKKASASDRLRSLVAEQSRASG